MICYICKEIVDEYSKEEYVYLAYRSYTNNTVLLYMEDHVTLVACTFHVKCWEETAGPEYSRRQIIDSSDELKLLEKDRKIRKLTKKVSDTSLDRDCKWLDMKKRYIELKHWSMFGFLFLLLLIVAVMK